MSALPDGVLRFVAWARDGSEHEASDPWEAIRAAYYVKAPGLKRKPVLLMERRAGGTNLAGERQYYSVPRGFHVPATE